MKKLVLLSIVIMALAFHACDKIDGPYTVPVPAHSWNGKKILLEDYTGHACVNCPGAAKDARDLEALYGNEIIVIAVHVSTDFAAPTAQLPQEFRTATGNDWDAKFGISPLGLPRGMINRQGYPTSHVINDYAWSSKIATIITQVPYMTITFKDTLYTDADSTIKGNIDVKFTKLNNYNLKLSICITEDSIIGPQLNNPNPGGGGDPDLPAFVPNYVFMHLLRGSINGSWGTQITTGTVPNAVNSEIVTPYTYKVPKSSWNVKNCHIVAFVYDAVTYEVYQAEQIKMY